MKAGQRAWAKKADQSTFPASHLNERETALRGGCFDQLSTLREDFFFGAKISNNA